MSLRAATPPATVPVTVLVTVLLVCTGLAAPAALAGSTGTLAARSAGGVVGVPGVGDHLASEQPSAGTPHVLNGRVYSIAQVGDTVFLGGTFTRVREDGPAPLATPVLQRRGLVAFSASTGRVLTTFRPQVVGGVRVVEPAADGESLYVGGTFTTIDGDRYARLARLRTSDGAVVPSFDPSPVAGKVRDLRLRDGRLWVAGAFTHIGGRARKALATLSPSTGRPTGYMTLRVGGHHRRGQTQVLKLDVSPDGSRLVAVGNFARLAGARAHQLLTLDLRGTVARPGRLRTRFYEEPCSRHNDSYMRDVDFSPDGRYFVVATTGAYGGGSAACDSVSRFEAAATGRRVQPSWNDQSGGDTTYAVEVTGPAVYVGGHERWWNNPFAGNRPGPGAVARNGIAALDPLNGLPLAWDPGRDRGAGVFDFLATEQGLWLVSDTVHVAGEYHARVALLPRGAAVPPPVRRSVVPNDVYVGGVGGSDRLERRRLVGPSGPVEGPTTAPDGGVDWSSVRAAFMVDGWLYLAHPDGSLTRRTFDGTTYGAAEPVATQDRIRVLTSWRDDVRNATAMFFQDGRIYFTRSGSDALHYRYFSPSSGVVGARRRAAAQRVRGFHPADVRGMAATSTHLYVAGADGGLRLLGWRPRSRHGVPVASSARRLSGPALDGTSWAGRALFLYSGPGGAPAPAPTAPAPGPAPEPAPGPPPEPAPGPGLAPGAGFAP
ncbi:hypothetical protein [Nocardioides sp. Arc9.136]|uniref:hypothetical protein n=1 Tax=Nocardioides sp. Arc9.136 TaxID=2996826 RepID=UPI0026652A92|nr:hypothetical protein [Nocardioides sp. Arc9.136]WKN46987.1 hypothetical protein OSR43_13165 [Nocardioides sp. Arc9.136]